MLVVTGRRISRSRKRLELRKVAVCALGLQRATTVTNSTIILTLLYSEALYTVSPYRAYPRTSWNAVCLARGRVTQQRRQSTHRTARFAAKRETDSKKWYRQALGCTVVFKIIQSSLLPFTWGRWPHLSDGIEGNT
jgi:hypothetical protein